MITGHNTDINHNGVVYHVQTEDKGRSNPVIETLVYKGGEILDARRTSYIHLIKEGYEEKKIIDLIEEQHRIMITEIKGGKYDRNLAAVSTGSQPRPDPLAEGIVDAKKSLDQVILDYLASEEEKERLILSLQSTQELWESSPCTLSILTRSSTTEQPLKGSKIIVKIISTVKKPITIYEGKTDRNGVLIVEFVVPDFPDGNAALLIQAFSDLGSDEMKHLIKKRKKGASGSRG